MYINILWVIVIEVFSVELVIEACDLMINEMYTGIDTSSIALSYS